MMDKNKPLKRIFLNNNSIQLMLYDVELSAYQEFDKKWYFVIKYKPTGTELNNISKDIHIKSILTYDYYEYSLEAGLEALELIVAEKNIPKTFTVYYYKGQKKAIGLNDSNELFFVKDI